MPLPYAVGDIVHMKKAHPCGCHEWEILRVGMDFRIRCQKCGHLVMLPRAKFEKNVRRVLAKAECDATALDETVTDRTALDGAAPDRTALDAMTLNSTPATEKAQ